MTSVLWRRIDGSGLDRSELVAIDRGHRLSGTSLFAADDDPVEIRFSVVLDSAWTTTTVGVHVRTGTGDRSVALTTDGAGMWQVGNDEVAELSGAVDVDFGWTPATNTIPIRRLNLDVGAAAETRVVFIPFPDREIESRTHRYERLAERRYRFQSGDFETDLTVNEHGLVTTYPGSWTALASA
jgi:hypothetical protein